MGDLTGEQESVIWSRQEMVGGVTAGEKVCHGNKRDRNERK